jgi:hypothetical protein
MDKHFMAIVLLGFCLMSFGDAKEAVLTEIPEMEGYACAYSRQLGMDKLEAEYRLFLPESLKFQEISDRGRDEAQKGLDLMLKDNWTLIKENRQRRGAEFFFRKDIILDAKVTIAPSSKPLEGKQKNYIFIRFEINRLIPSEDVPGIDYLDVPRFPGSTRIRWMDLLGDYSAKYLLIGSVEEVKKFFQEKLEKLGWKPVKGHGTLNYTKGGVKTPGEASIDKKDLAQPLEMVKKLIPTTLAVHLDKNEGITEIGIGRSAGSADAEQAERPAVTPAKVIEEIKDKLLVSIDKEKEIPLYQGLEKKREELLPLTLNGEEIFRQQYERKKVEQQEALNIGEYYLNELQDKGWNLQDDEWHGLRRALVFQKGAVKINVKVNAIGRYPIPERAPKINVPVEIDIIYSIPTKDIVGEEIKDVPRFPGSVFFYFLKAAKDHTVKYKAAAGRKEVEWFYIEELPEHGWTFSGCDMTGLLFVPSDTTKSAADALSKGKLVPTTLKLKVDEMWDGTVKIGLTRSQGD